MPPQGITDLVETLLTEVEENPDKHWYKDDFSKMGVNSITVRRQFKKRFGVTFTEYARLSRLERALNLIQSGESIIDVQISMGYESSSGLREAFYRSFGVAPSKLGKVNILKSSLIDTPFGPMKAIANDDALYFLDFVDSKNVDLKIGEVTLATKSIIFPGTIPQHLSIEKELNLYFAGRLKEFTTPIWLEGPTSRKNMWNEIRKIPFGEIRNPSDIIRSLGCHSREVLDALSANRFAIVIPFHRLLNEKLGSAFCKYNITRNQWLINHEQVVCRRNLC